MANALLRGGGGSAGPVTPPTPPERTVYLQTAVLPAIAGFLAGDQIIFTAPSAIQSMSFERAGAGFTYRGQSGTPFLTKVKTATERDAIGALLAAGQEYWYALTEDDGLDVAGYYRITNDGATGGIQVGPYLQGGSGGGSTTPTTPEVTSFGSLSVVPTSALFANDGDQLVVTGGLLSSMILERVGSAVAYRSQASHPIRTALLTTAQADIVAQSMGVAGSTYYYILADFDSASADKRLVRVLSFDSSGTLKGLQSTINIGGSGGGSATPSTFTAQSGWADINVTDIPEDRTLTSASATIQEVTAVEASIIRSLRAAGIFTD